MSLAVALRCAAFVGALAACGPDAECTARCAQYGIEGEACTRMCTLSCEELEQTYGVAPDTCRRLQTGDDP